MASLTQDEKNRIFNGIWYTIHMLAAKADKDTSLRQSYREYIRMLSQNSLPCGKCSEHMNEYLRNHPLETEPSYFIWSYEFHNWVNESLGKGRFDEATAKSFYMGDDSVCTKCGDEVLPSVKNSSWDHNPGMVIRIPPASIPR